MYIISRYAVLDVIVIESEWNHLAYAYFQTKWEKVGQGNWGRVSDHYTLSSLFLIFCLAKVWDHKCYSYFTFAYARAEFICFLFKVSLADF